MNQGRWLFLFGVFDILTFVSVVLRDLINGGIPFHSQHIHFSASWQTFFQGTTWHSFDWLGIVPVILIASTLVTGVLLIQNKKSGIILSLAHAPFRLLFISIPSFGVISYVYYQWNLPAAYLIFAIVYGLEIVKTIILIKAYKTSQVS